MQQSDSDIEKIHSITMTEDEVDSFLTTQGHGILALAKGNDSYGVPISFGYTQENGEDVIYLYLLKFGETSKKLEYCDHTDQACLIVYDVESQHRWRSVIVTGTVQEWEGRSMMDDEYIDDVMGDNAWFPVFDSLDDPITESRRFLFDIEEKTGRQGSAYQ